MKKLSILIIAIALFTVGYAQEIHVNSATELIRAIGSNKTIVIEGGFEFNLTEALQQLNDNYPEEFPMLNEFDFDEQIKSINNKVFFIYSFDGPEIAMKGIKNMTIKGNSDYLPTLLARPRYAYIFNLYDCSNITFENLIMGHTKEGSCMGGVVGLNNCKNITITNCDLFGCGTEGLTGINVEGLTFNNSHIHDCTYHIMTLENCKNCNFSNSLFFNNREYDLINIKGKYTTTIHFKNCHFFQNQGLLFYLSDSIHLENCFISHPSDSWGTTEIIMSKGTVWSIPVGFSHDDEDED